jgi:AcrR family transcriptional regulator
VNPVHSVNSGDSGRAAPSIRLPADERQAAIVRSVRRAFADKGFHGTTTRELARVAGVSEALLFKHFPTKEALFAGMQEAFKREMDSTPMRRFDALEPCTETLVLTTHELVTHFLAPPKGPDDEAVLQNRLMFHSLLGDGEFARFMANSRPAERRQRFRAAFRAAVAAGDAVDGPVDVDLLPAMVFQMLSAMKLHMSHSMPGAPDQIPNDHLVRQVAWFVLRGFGIKEEAIHRCYRPEPPQEPAG